MLKSSVPCMMILSNVFMLPVNLLLITGVRCLTYGLAGMSLCLSNMLLLERPLDSGQRQADPDRECCLITKNVQMLDFQGVRGGARGCSSSPWISHSTPIAPPRK